MDYLDQVAEWVKGNPIHDDETGRCVPDFSCCRPMELAELPWRVAFQAAVENDPARANVLLHAFVRRSMRMQARLASGEMYVEH